MLGTRPAPAPAATWLGGAGTAGACWERGPSRGRDAVHRLGAEPTAQAFPEGTRAPHAPAASTPGGRTPASRPGFPDLVSFPLGRKALPHFPALSWLMLMNLPFHSTAQHLMMGAALTMKSYW